MLVDLPEGQVLLIADVKSIVFPLSPISSTDFTDFYIVLIIRVLDVLFLSKHSQCIFPEYTCKINLMLMLSAYIILRPHLNLTLCNNNYYMSHNP
jgi:hypothetical protein